MSPKPGRFPADKVPRPMWKSFLQSMGLLVLAMGTALYSTATSRAGNLPATILSAAASLVIAAWVGLRFVPRLAQGVDWAWIPRFAKYKITREGVIFLVALFVVLSAAVNTSNNLLYMVLSACLPSCCSQACCRSLISGRWRWNCSCRRGHSREKHFPSRCASAIPGGCSPRSLSRRSLPAMDFTSP